MLNHPDRSTYCRVSLFGLGLYATVNFSELYLIMLAIWIAQLLFSVWWLARFRYGPLEWLWRNLTYGKRQPLRR